MVNEFEYVLGRESPGELVTVVVAWTPPPAPMNRQTQRQHWKHYFAALSCGRQIWIILIHTSLFNIYGTIFSRQQQKKSILLLNGYGLFTLADPDSDPYLDSDSCTMQKFHIGSDSDSDPLIEMYVVGTEICP